MKTELEVTDIQAIAAAVAEFMKPQFANLKTGEADDRIMGVPELSEYLGMSDKWVYDQTAQNRIPFFKLGSITKFRKSEIDKWMRKFDTPAVGNPSALKKLVGR